MASSTEQLATIATNALNNPKLLEQIVERVYTLIREDLRQQQERVGTYGNTRG